MSNEFKKNVNEKMKEIQQEVYIKDDILRKIVGLLLCIQEGKFPSKKPPRGLLLHGPPGTGKTLLMKILAEKLEISEPIMIRGPEIISQYYGKSEARFRQVFALARERAEEENLAIIYIDELDSLTPHRDLTKGELEPRLVGQLLSLMDGLEKEVPKGHVVVIGSTNRPDALDLALRRPGRFDLEIEFDPPDIDERKEILKILLNNYTNGDYTNINLDLIAEQTIGFTGADLLLLINESLLHAALEGKKPINQKDMLIVKNNIRPSAIREFNIEKPKNKESEITDKETVEKIKEIADLFSNNPSFKFILISKDLRTANDISSTIAYLVSEKLYSPYLVVRTTRFRKKWFGETERSIRELFEKVKRLQPCVVYFKNFNAIAMPTDEHLHGAILELIDYLIEFSDNNNKVLLLCSITENDPIIIKYFEDINVIDVIV